MPRYIDADAIDLGRVSDSICQWQAQEAIDDTPTADVVEVVRCKECKWYQEGYDIDGKWFTHCKNIRTYGPTSPNWFCADGERRTDDAETH